MRKPFRVFAGILTVLPTVLLTVLAVLAVLAWARGAQAATYTCPAPSLINCVPVKKVIGAWRDNGGMTTGNTFSPNSVCANVIPLSKGRVRLLCCYAKCGVFLRDVKANACTKPSESEFSCN